MTVAAVAFVILAALLLWLLAAQRGRWPVKLALIVAVPAFGFAIWHSADSLKGWPTGTKPPKTATFVWGVVVEPDPQTGDRGAIYLWLAAGDTPRAYRLPYSRPLHKQVEQAKTLTKRGTTVAVARNHKTASTHGQSRARSQFRFYRLPPSQPPRKQQTP